MLSLHLLWVVAHCVVEFWRKVENGNLEIAMRRKIAVRFKNQKTKMLQHDWLI